jgi:hypothetical protein
MKQNAVPSGRRSRNDRLNFNPDSKLANSGANQNTKNTGDDEHPSLKKLRSQLEESKKKEHMKPKSSTRKPK